MADTGPAARLAANRARPLPSLPTPDTGPPAGGDILDPAAPDERWSLVYTHSNCEKRLSRACFRLGIRHYLPLRDHLTGGGGRHSVALFPSYVFACLTHRARIEMLETGAVVRVHHVHREDILLDELRHVRQALTAGADLTVGPALVRGERVRMIRGPLLGVEGLVVVHRRRGGHPRLVLNISILGQSVTTEIDLLDVIRVPAIDGGTAGSARQEAAPCPYIPARGL
jgi:hypothetical protein